jgi:hypothetical protein
MMMFCPAANPDGMGFPLSVGTVVVGSDGPNDPEPKLTRMGASTVSVVDVVPVPAWGVVPPQAASPAMVSTDNDIHPRALARRLRAACELIGRSEGSGKESRQALASKQANGHEHRHGEKVHHDRLRHPPQEPPRDDEEKHEKGEPRQRQ